MTGAPSYSRRYLIVAGGAATAMAATGLGTSLVRPNAAPLAPAPDLAALTPKTFGVWTQVTLGSAVLPVESTLTDSEVVSYQAYTDDIGRVATLVMAYGPPLGDGVRLHRPETCYRAQGYAVSRREVSRLSVDGVTPALVHLDTRSGGRREAVSYWLRDGDKFITAVAQRQLSVLQRGFSPRADGALVRLSTSGEGRAAFELHRQFLTDFAAAMSPTLKALLIGAPKTEGLT